MMCPNRMDVGWSLPAVGTSFFLGQKNGVPRDEGMNGCRRVELVVNGCNGLRLL